MTHAPLSDKPRVLFELVDPTGFHGIRYWDWQPSAKSTDGFEKLIITKFVEYSALEAANKEIERLEAVIAALTVKILT